MERRDWGKESRRPPQPDAPVALAGFSHLHVRQGGTGRALQCPRLGFSRALCAQQCLASGLKVQKLCPLGTPALTFPVLSSADTLAFFSWEFLNCFNQSKASNFRAERQDLLSSLMAALEQPFLPENGRLNAHHQLLVQPSFLLLMLPRGEGSCGPCQPSEALVIKALKQQNAEEHL